MSNLDWALRQATRTTAQIAADSTTVLLSGQIVWNTSNGTYAIGDGTTVLNALTFYGGTAGLTVGTSAITGGTNTRILYNNSGVLGEYSVTGTGTTAVLSTSPTFTTDITTPLIYGGSASGGNLTIQSTSNATKGTIFHGATTTDTKHVFYVGTGASAIQLRSLVGTLSQSAIYLGVAPGSETSANYAFNWDGSLALNSQGTTNAIDFRQGGSSRFTIYGATTSGANPRWLINFPQQTGITASTESQDILINSKTQTWAAGNITNQRWFYYKTQTAAFASASTITNSYGLYVEAATAGTNATITNNYAAGFSGNVTAQGRMFITDTIGSTALGYDLEVNKAVNGGVESWVRNTTSGTAAFAQVAVRSNSTQQMKMAILSAGYTNSGLLQTNTALLLSVAADMLLIGNQTTTKPIIFVNGGTATTDEVFRISAINTIDIYEARNLTFGTTTGTKLGTATTQKLSFWNATPIVQPTTAVAEATLVGGGGTNITDTDTFDGYTLKQIVKALRNTGLLA